MCRCGPSTTTRNDKLYNATYVHENYSFYNYGKTSMFPMSARTQTLDKHISCFLEAGRAHRPHPAIDLLRHTQPHTCQAPHHPAQPCTPQWPMFLNAIPLAHHPQHPNPNRIPRHPAPHCAAPLRGYKLKHSQLLEQHLCPKQNTMPVRQHNRQLFGF